jgi:hypothetical protein
MYQAQDSLTLVVYGGFLYGKMKVDKKSCNDWGSDGSVLK